MKRFKLSLSLLLAVFSSVIFFANCGGGGDDNATPTVIANWSVSSVNPSSAAPNLQGGTFNFTASTYTATNNGGGQYASGPYTIQGNNLTFAGTGPISGKTFSFSFAGNNLTLQGSVEEAGKAPVNVTIVLSRQ